MEASEQMEPKVRPLITMCDIDGKTVVSAEIPGVDISERPVFYRGVTAALAGVSGGGNITIPVYIGGDKIDEILVKSESRRNLRSGGR